MLILNIDRNSTLPLTRQIYNQLRSLILTGVLKGSEKIPSSRELAADLDVSRIVVVEAYELLMAEGFLEGKIGSGTFIATGAYLKNKPTPTTCQKPVHSNNQPRIKDYINFRSGIPALELFPRKKWAEISHRVCLDTPHSVLSYDSPEGRVELRETIADYLSKTRGVIADPEQILITSGSVQGLVLTAQCLLNSNGCAVVEDPTNQDIRKIFTVSGGAVVPVSVDEYGIQTTQLPKKYKPNLIQVTPSHQFPIGGNLPIQRRIELIEYAAIIKSYIVEDDYDSEYRYEGPPISSLQGLAPELVIYLGTFSKILFPALRIGYMIVPPKLVNKIRNSKRLSDMHTNSLNQLTLARFMQEGYLQRHIYKMKKIYQKRRDTLISILKCRFEDQVTVIGQTTGLHLVADFKTIQFNDGIIKKALDKGVKIYPVEAHTIEKNNHTGKLIFGYGHLSEEQIEEGIKRLAGILRR